MMKSAVILVLIVCASCDAGPGYRDYLRPAESPQECDFETKNTAAVFLHWRAVETCEALPAEFIGCMDMTVVEPWRPTNPEYPHTADDPCNSCLERADGSTYCARRIDCYRDDDVTIEEEAAFRWIRSADSLGQVELAGSPAHGCFLDELAF